jgi:diaminohydroxyphosphoribosylaminopyrimidine deaminase/5-amino-6-(5-phosphoribosylamino)uracil reductase
MSHEDYMLRAIELATLGFGHVSPNPMVGAVIVHEDRIIGEGWHRKFGEAHAEVNAINSVKKPELLALSTCYVTLEPCFHFGKTPPCADLLIHSGIRKVVIANTDPNPLVNGKGIEKLRKAGIEVIIGVEEKRALELNKRFFTFVQKERPYIILKWAETADGFIANSNRTPVSISRSVAQMHSHKWRTEEDAILVGTETVINDNPSLTSRKWQGKDPLRIVWDPNNRTPSDATVFTDRNPTLYFCSLSNPEKPVEHILIPPQEDPLKFLISILYQRSISSVIIEGGPRLHEHFIRERLFDEIRIFKSKNLILKEGIPAARIPSGIVERHSIDLPSDILRFFSLDFQPF